MKPTKANVAKVAASYGATLDECGTFFNIDAPAGKVWDAHGGHSLHVETFRPADPAAWRTESYADALERMAYGLSPCEQDECDMCAESAAANGGAA